MENIPYADFFKAHAAELDDLSGQPRSYYVCVPVLIDWYQKGGDGDWAYTGTTTRTDYLLINGTLSGGSNNVWSDILIKVTTKTGSSNTGNGNSGSGNSGNGNERPNTPLVDLTPEERDCLKQGGLETSFRMTSLSKSISPCPDIRMDEIIENAIQSIYAAGECDDPEAFYDAVDAQIQSLYETCEIRTVTLCLEPEDLYSLPDDPLGGYYINLLHLGVNYLDTDTGDQIFTNFPQFCIQVNKSFGSLLPGRTRSKYKIQQAIRMSIQGVQAQLDGYMIPPTSVAAKEEFKLLLRQNLAGAFGGGTSFTTAGCPGVPTMVADMSCF